VLKIFTTRSPVAGHLTTLEKHNSFNFTRREDKDENTRARHPDNSLTTTKPSLINAIVATQAATHNSCITGWSPANHNVGQVQP
jgi:hypothetical protein